MNIKIISAFVAVLIILAIWVSIEHQSNKRLKYENKILNQNVAALNDSVRITKTKNGELEADKKTLISDKISELEKLNSDLAAEVKKTKGKVITLQKDLIAIKTNTDIPVVVTPVPPNNPTDTVNHGIIATANLDSTYSPGNYRKAKITVKITPTDTSANLQEVIGMRVITGLKKNEKGDYEILFRSDYPGIEVLDLQGAYIPQNQIKPYSKPHRLSLGVGVGYMPLSYDIDAKRLEIRNQIAAGAIISYKIF